MILVSSLEEGKSTQFYVKPVNLASNNQNFTGHIKKFIVALEVLSDRRRSKQRVDLVGW